MFHYIAGVPHPKTGRPIRVRRVVVTGKPVPDALLTEMKELDAQLHSKDETTRSVARLQKYALMQRLKDEGCVEWETEL